MKRSYTVRSVMMLLAICIMLFACKQKDPEPTGEAGTEPKSGAETVASSTPSSASTTEDPNQRPADAEPFVCEWSSARDSFLTEDYILYHDNHGRVQIFDTKTKKDLVYCFDPGCEHKIAKRSMTGEILEPGCIAYELSSKTVMIWDDKLYFVADKEVRVSDRQGLNQRVIGKIPGYVTGYDIFFMKDKLFLIWGTQNEMIEVKDDNGESRWIMGEQKEKETTGILCFDLNEKTWTKVFEAEDFQSYLSQYDIRGDHMRFAYWHWGLPYMDMNGETYGRTIPEEYRNLTTEEYRAELDRQCWVDIYDYNSVTGELKAALKQKHLPAGRIAMCKDFFALPEDGETVFYRYDGEVFNRIDGAFVMNAWSDSHLVCSMENDPTNYVLIDETTGELLKKTAKPITPGTLYPAAIIGNSCYGSLTVDGLWSIGYISTADFWNGDLTNAVQMHYYSDTSMQSGAIWSTIPPTQEETTETTETTETETMAETTEVQTEPTETTEPTTLSPEEEAYEASLPRVTWKLHYSSMIDQQNRDAINRLLKEKGMDFRIDFSTAMVDFDDYPKWLQTQIDNNNMPDIVTTPALAHGIFDQVAFAEKALLSLNDYLESEDGKALWETFSDLQWDLVKVNGIIYSIPDKKGGDNGAVLYVRDSYKKDFEEAFDGTYASLSNLCRSLSGPKRTIVSRYEFNIGIITALLGDLTVFDATYDADAGAFIDILNEERTKEFIEQLYEDYRDGYWVNDGNLDNIPEDALAIITLGNGWDLHGFTPYALTENLFPTNIAGTYGVSASSRNKALALRAMVICYSDPEIASKLTYTTNLSAQEWKQRNEATRQYKSTEFTGFIPYLSEEQITKLYDSVADLNKLTSELYEDKNTQKGVNPNYTNFLDRYFKKKKDYSDVVEELNRQLQIWNTTKENSTK